MKEIVDKILKQEKEAREKIDSARKEAENIILKAKKEAQQFTQQSEQKLRQEIETAKNDSFVQYLAQKEKILKETQEFVQFQFQKSVKNIPDTAQKFFNQIIEIKE